MAQKKGIGAMAGNKGTTWMAERAVCPHCGEKRGKQGRDINRRTALLLSGLRAVLARANRPRA